MWMLGLAIVVGVVAYGAFVGVDRLILPVRTERATVIGKEYRQPGLARTTEMVGGRVRTVATASDEAHVLRVMVTGREAEAVVERSVYESANTGDEVTVVYEQGRLTGALRILRVDGR